MVRSWFDPWHQPQRNSLVERRLFQSTFYLLETRFSSQPGVANEILESDIFCGKNLRLKAEQPSCLSKKCVPA